METFTENVKKNLNLQEKEDFWLKTFPLQPRAENFPG